MNRVLQIRRLENARRRFHTNPFVMFAISVLLRRRSGAGAIVVQILDVGHGGTGRSK